MIKRGKGVWKGIEIFDLENKVTRAKSEKSKRSIPTISTLKTSLPQKNTEETALSTNQEFIGILQECVKFVDANGNELSKLGEKWASFWCNSIKEINKLFV